MGISKEVEEKIMEDVVKNKMTVAAVAKKYDLTVYMVKKILNRLYGETATEKPASGRYNMKDVEETAKTADSVDEKHIHIYKSGNTYKVDEVTGQIYRLDVCTICGHIIKVPVDADIKTLGELTTKELNENQDEIRKELNDRQHAEDIKMWRMEIALDFRKKGLHEYRNPANIGDIIDEVNALSDRMVKYLHSVLYDNDYLHKKGEGLAKDLETANAMLRSYGVRNPRFVDEDGDEPDSYPSRRYLSGFAPYVK